MAEITCDIREHLGVLSVNDKTEWRTEANIISWNGGPEKIDIRTWSPDRSKRSKGITLKKEEARALVAALGEYFREG